MKLLTLLLVLTVNLAHATPAPVANPVTPFKKVVWVWLENTSYDAMMGQRYVRNLWLNYPSVRFTKMNQVSLITQANAIAMISGNDFGIHDNELVRVFTPTIVNLLESKSITWKVYAEQYPGACYLNEGIGDYKRYRVPFLSVSQIQTDRYLCSKVVSFKFLEDDLKYGSLPDFSIVIPSLKGSGATSGINSASNTLQSVLDPILYNSDLLAQTTIIISTTTNSDLKKPELFTMIIGNGVANYALTNEKPYSHYNVLRTIEEGFHLGHLNQNDAKAESMTGFWK
jgi:phospholipase C